MGRMRKSLKKIGENKFDFDTQEELTIYKYLICRSLRKKYIKKLKTKNVLFDYYSDWKKFVISTHKSKNEKELRDFSCHLEQRIRNEQIISKYNALVIPILLTAFLTTILAVLPDVFNQDFSGVHWAVGVLAFGVGFAVIICVGYFCVDFFNDMINYQTRENLFIDYKKVIDEMIRKQHFFDRDFKSIEEANIDESSLTVSESKVEIRNINADVDIEMPNMSIHIKQK